MSAPPVTDVGRADHRFESFCVAGAWGAHATPQAGVTMLGRYWTTTSRGSLKRRAIERLPIASMARVDTEHDVVRIAAGRARILDPFSPPSAIADPFGASVLGLVVAGIAVDHLDEVRGYGELIRQVPDAWSVRGRVVLSLDVDDRLVAGPDGIVEATGSWASAQALPSIRRRNRIGPIRLDAAPEPVRRLAADAWSADVVPPTCSVGITTATGPVALPAVWDPEHGSALVRRDVLARIGADIDEGACITLDRGAARADRKVGVILRGRPVLRRLPTSHDHADGHVGVVVDPERLSWWSGFESGTIRTNGRAAA